MTPTRVILIVMDSVGVGELPDAAVYGDEGSDTLGNTARAIPLAIPTLRSLGLAMVARIGGDAPAPRGAAGRMAESSPGKDSVTGHWEMTGLVLDRPFPTFPHGFPADKIRAFEARLGRRTSATSSVPARRSWTAWRRAHADRRADHLHVGRQVP